MALFFVVCLFVCLCAREGSGKSELTHALMQQHQTQVKLALSLAEQRKMTPAQPFGPATTCTMKVDHKDSEKIVEICTGVAVSADKYFIGPDGVYRFDGKHIAVAHASCLGYFIDALVANIQCIVVDNTSSTRWEYSNYIKLARAYGYEVVVSEIKCDNIETLQVFQGEFKYRLSEPTEWMSASRLVFISAIIIDPCKFAPFSTFFPLSS